MVKVQAREMPGHFQNHGRNCKHAADPEAAAHVDQFGARTGFFSGADRLQRHAANRAIARLRPPDLRVHGAGVDGAFRGGRARHWSAWLRVARRIGVISIIVLV